MKILMRIGDWVDYYMEATPQEVSTLNKLIGSARTMNCWVTERVLTLGTDRPDLQLRILADDCVATQLTEDPKE